MAVGEGARLHQLQQPDCVCSRRLEHGEQTAADAGGQSTGDATLTACGAGPQQPPSAAPSSPGNGEVRGADAGLRQVELHVARSFPVTSQGGDDRAGLLVAGGQQEGRGTAVGLRADGVVARFGVREFVDAVRRDGAAGVLVGIDQRGERAGRTEDRVQVETQLGDDVVVGPETRSSSRPCRRRPSAPRRSVHAAIRSTGDGFDAEAASQFDAAGLDELLHSLAERAAGW